jgi:lauroyl/myristoyl acyltransferase
MNGLPPLKRTNINEFEKSKKTVTPTKAGVQKYLKLMDSCFPRNDKMGGILTSYKSIKIIFREIDYYFFRLPYYSLRRVEEAYRKIRSFAERRREKGREERVAKNLKTVFGERMGEGEIERASKKYFEVLCYDDLDAWLWLIQPWTQLKKIIRVEGEEHFRGVTDKRRGCILLSAHFGGAFFIFDLVRELGGKPQVLGRPIKWIYFKKNFFRWIYNKFRFFCMTRSIGERVIYSERKGTRREVFEKLERGYHIVITFDVPPHFSRGKIEKVNFLERDWNFPRGFFEVIAERDIPIVPFFVSLGEDDVKTFRFYPSYQIKNQDEIKGVFQECAKIFESHLLKTPEQWFFWDDAGVFW